MAEADALVDDVPARLAAAIDRGSSLPVSVQLKGALEYGIASGEVPCGTRLPSVRTLARRLGLSPVTVSGVYALLREAGLVEGRVGSGTFVARGGLPPQEVERLRVLQGAIEEVVRLGREAGLSPAELAVRVSTAPAAPRPVRLLMLGTFHDATEGYAEAIRPHLRPGDTIVARTTDSLAGEPPPEVDLVVAPRTLRATAQGLLPGLPVVGITLIPNEATRVALAAIAPEARVLAVSHFAEFLPVLRGGVARFAPHATRLKAVARDEEGLAALLAGTDVLVHSTGADDLRRALRPGQAAIEYRHTPDGHAIEAELLPAIAACRGRLRSKKEPALEDQPEQLVRDRRVSGT